jgi:hypothetical protein
VKSETSKIDQEVVLGMFVWKGNCKMITPLPQYTCIHKGEELGSSAFFSSSSRVQKEATKFSKDIEQKSFKHLLVPGRLKAIYENICSDKTVSMSLLFEETEQIKHNDLQLDQQLITLNQ